MGWHRYFSMFWMVALGGFLTGCGALPLSEEDKNAAADDGSDDALCLLSEACDDDLDDTDDGADDVVIDQNSGTDDAGGGGEEPGVSRPDLGAFGRLGKVATGEAVMAVAFHGGHVFGGSWGKTMFKIDPVSSSIVEQVNPAGVGGNMFRDVAVDDLGNSYWVSDGWPTQLTEIDLNAPLLGTVNSWVNEAGKREAGNVVLAGPGFAPYTMGNDGWSNGGSAFLGVWTVTTPPNLAVTQEHLLSGIGGAADLTASADGAFIYLATGGNPALVYKVDAASGAVMGDPVTLTGADSLEHGCFLDETRNQLVCASRNAPVKIFRIDLATFTLLDSLDVPDHSLVCAIYDDVTDKAYFGINSAPAAVLKVDMASFTIEATSAPFETGEDYTPGCAQDRESGMLFFGVMNAGAGIVSVAP